MAKRTFTKYPSTYIGASSFWILDVYTTDEVRAEINKAVSSGCNIDDVDDYLQGLKSRGTITENDYIDLLNYASDIIWEERDNWERLPPYLTEDDMLNQFDH